MARYAKQTKATANRQQKAEFNVNQLPGESLEIYYKRLAKQADQRLVRLEEASKKEGMQNILGYAYSKAKKDIEAKWDKFGKVKPGKPPRFNRAIPKKKDGQVNEKMLKKKIADIKDFIQRKSSTEAGIVDSYMRAADTTSERYGLDLSWEEMADFYSSEAWKKLCEKFGDSKTAARVAGVIRKNANEIRNALKENREVNLHMDDSVLEGWVRDTITDQGIEWEELVSKQ